MIRIEMVVSAETGRTTERIWLNGQNWPISPEEDKDVVRLEAFGPELNIIHALGVQVDTARLGDVNGRVLCETWYLENARQASRAMRAHIHEKVGP